MSFREKEKALLEFLSQNDNYFTSNEIAEKLEISTRTVARYIEKINERSDEDQLIISEKGRGYRINYPEYLRNKEQQSQNSFFSPVERHNEILLKILFSSPRELKVINLFEKYYVSETVINGDLMVIKQQLKKQKIQLIRKSHNVGVKGSELAIRRAILQNITKANDIETEKISSKFPTLNRYDMRFIIEQFRLIENHLNSIIPYPYNINIFSHIYILVSRYRNGFATKNQKFKLVDVSSNEERYRNQKFFEIADIIIDNLSKYLGQELPQEEKIFLLQYLNSSRLFFKNTNKLNFSTEIIEITMEIINGVSTVSGIAFNIEQLKTELINHIKPLVNRVKNHIEITNKLLTDIQNEYSQIFVQVKQVVNEVFQEHFQQKLDDDEIGFITLYFAKFIEQNPPKIRVLIMCASGVGTSELLKVKVHKFFPELQIKDVISLRQYQKEKSFYDQQVDFIITTIFAEKVSIKPTLLVNAMFNKNDQINVNKMLKVLRENGK